MTLALPFAWIVLAAPPTAMAQDCDWLPGEGVPGTNGTVLATTTWDPDGPEPEPELLILGGDFTVAGDVVAHNIAAWDGSLWHPRGSGLSGGDNPRVYALTLYSGELIAGGSFSRAGDYASAYWARWGCEPDCCPCPGDLSEPCDDVVNATDFTVFAAAFGSWIGDPNYNTCADVAPAGNPDGVVDVTDFTQFAAAFGVPCP